MLCLLLLGACGSAGPAAVTSSAVRTTCQAVSAVLSDGPDPGADPVGYAEAQVLPLRQIHAPDRNLRSAIDALASAYQRVFETNGSKAADESVARATERVDGICPGAAA